MSLPPGAGTTRKGTERPGSLLLKAGVGFPPHPAGPLPGPVATTARNEHGGLTCGYAREVRRQGWAYFPRGTRQDRAPSPRQESPGDGPGSLPMRKRSPGEGPGSLPMKKRSPGVAGPLWYSLTAGDQKVRLMRTPPDHSSFSSASILSVSVLGIGDFTRDGEAGRQGIGGVRAGNPRRVGSPPRGRRRHRPTSVRVEVEVAAECDDVSEGVTGSRRSHP